jgi:hypothetical protein
MERTCLEGSIKVGLAEGTLEHLHGQRPLAESRQE